MSSTPFGSLEAPPLSTGVEVTGVEVSRTRPGGPFVGARGILNPYSLLVTSASLLVTSALLVVTRSY